MTFFYFKDDMKKNPSIKIARELWATPHYYIYWNRAHNAFYEHFANIDREWAAADFIEDLTARDWRRV